MAQNVDELIKNLNDSVIQDIPPWAVLLMNTMKGLLNEFKELNGLVNRIATLEHEKIAHECQIDSLKTEITNLELHVDDLEQRSRNSCLMVHGISENADENTDELVLDDF